MSTIQTAAVVETSAVESMTLHGTVTDAQGRSYSHYSNPRRASQTRVLVCRTCGHEASAGTWWSVQAMLGPRSLSLNHSCG